jgi:hypothetical protein
MDLFDLLTQPRLFTRSRASDPDTSRAAVASIADDLTKIQAEVYEALKRAGEKGLADFQLVQAIPGATENATYRTRRSELTAKGLVADSGRCITRSANGTGNRHTVWVLAEHAPDQIV